MVGTRIITTGRALTSSTSAPRFPRVACSRAPPGSATESSLHSGSQTPGTPSPESPTPLYRSRTVTPTLTNPWYPYQVSRRGWISVAYNQTVWIPCQPVFPEGFDRRSWAALYAEEWWSRSPRPHGKREVNALARTLEDMHAYAYSHMAMQMGFLHLPSLQLAPLLVSFGIRSDAG